jgi:hypothetical protein
LVKQGGSPVWEREEWEEWEWGEWELVLLR